MKLRLLLLAMAVMALGISGCGTRTQPQGELDVQAQDKKTEQAPTESPIAEEKIAPIANKPAKVEYSYPTKTINVKRLYSSLNSIKKDEFTSDAEYAEKAEIKLSALGLSGDIPFIVKPITYKNKDFTNYDANTGIFEFSVEAIESDDIFFRFAKSVYSIVFEKNITKSNYTGTNAFGVSANVKKGRGTVFGIKTSNVEFDKKGYLDSKEGVHLDTFFNCYLFPVNVDVEKARRLKSSQQVFLVCKLVKNNEGKYTGKAYSGESPTIQNPRDEDYDVRLVYVDILAALLCDASTKEIVKVVNFY